jgi:hypothetical protein
MGIKVTAFVFALVRWVSLVALALVPTLLVVVVYRKWRGEPLWKLSDLPVAAEVTLCLAWLSGLMMSLDLVQREAGLLLGSHLAIAAAASLIAAVPVMIGHYEIEILKRRLGLSGSSVPPARAHR